MPSSIYEAVLAITRIVLPCLSLLLVLLWVGLFASQKPRKKTLARFVPLQGLPLTLTSAEGVLGCKKHCDLYLPRPTIAKKHALFFQQEEKWLLTPLGGGVHVNEKPVTKTVSLLDGDVVAFGDEEFTFECNGLEREVVESTTPAKGGFPLFCLTLFQGAMALQLCLRYQDSFSIFLPLAFGVLMVGQWVYYLVEASRGKTTMLWELPVLYLTTLGFAVCACSVPETLPKQLFCALGGVVGCGLLRLLLKYQHLCFHLRYLLAGGSVALLWFTVLFGITTYGSTNWLAIGGFSFQPSEFAKIAFLTVGSCCLPVALTKGGNRWFFMAYAGLTMGALVCMVDFGAIAIFFVTMILLLMMRLTNTSLVGGMVLAAVAGGALALTLFPHIATRFSAWLHVWEMASTAGYQQTRTLISMASGGLLGVGGGNGTLLSVAAADTDLVFGVLCEEWGQLIGLCAALCFVALALTALRLSKTAPSTFQAMGVCGAAVMMVFQTALNLFGSTDILPLTGVTMMFVSRGGSSLMAAFWLTAFFKAAQDTPKPLETERRRYY